MAMVLSGETFEVLEVARRAGIVEKVVIKNWPFVMTFYMMGNKVQMMGFARYDGCQDEFYRIPKRYFVPAIQRARAIFKGYNKRAS